MSDPKGTQAIVFGECFKIGRFGQLYRFEVGIDEWVKSDNEDARKVLEGKIFVNSELLMGLERRQVMNINLRVYDKYINVEVNIDNSKIDLGFHNKNEAVHLLCQLEEIVDELSGMIERIKD